VRHCGCQELSALFLEKSGVHLAKNLQDRSHLEKEILTIHVYYLVHVNIE